MRPLSALMLAAALQPGMDARAAPPPRDDQGELAELHGRLDALQQAIRDFRSATDRRGDQANRAVEIKSLVQELIRDANRRSRTPVIDIAGWQQETGFHLQSDDSRHTMHVGGQIQFRAVFNAGDVDDRSGFESPRTKLHLFGNIRDSQWLYMVEGNFSGHESSFALDDGWIAHAFNDPNGTVFIGQLKLPFLREELVSCARQLAVERSLVNEAFTAGRSQGVLLDYRTGRWHVAGGISDGAEDSGGMNAPALARDTEYALTFRAEALLCGTWDSLSDFSSFRGEDRAAMLGAAFHLERGEFGDSGEERERFAWTADASIELGGAGIFGAVVGRRLGGDFEADQLGAIVQGGVFPCPTWEVFARFEWGDADMEDSEDLSIMTAGINRYVARHALKWSVDIGVALTEVAPVWVGGPHKTSVAGWRRDRAGGDGQVVIRSQLQVMF